MTIAKQSLEEAGFQIFENVFSHGEADALISLIEQCDQSAPSFRNAGQLFAIRYFLQVLPQASPLIWNTNLLALVNQICGKGYFVVKSVYFDKPPLSNWLVPMHQDLTISISHKHDAPGFHGWTQKEGLLSVQAPAAVLEQIYTIRIHLDDCDESNGALQVIPGSHKNGVIRPEKKDLSAKRTICPVRKGGVMIMKPLLLHASAKSTSEKQRRLIHIEICNVFLPDKLEWRERSELPL
jgi:ectoine hydroxylase-related dioxygenase (phytanoyl-CoA dioxygenase family)